MKNASLFGRFILIGNRICLTISIHSASHVDARIEAFLNQFNINLQDMTETELQTRVQSLIKLKQVPDVSLDEEVSRNWNEILNEEYLFDRLQQEVH